MLRVRIKVGGIVHIIHIHDLFIIHYKNGSINWYLIEYSSKFCANSRNFDQNIVFIAIIFIIYLCIFRESIQECENTFYNHGNFQRITIFYPKNFISITGS